MNNTALKSVIVCGLCVITASLFSGCAVPSDPQRMPMSTVDLNHFVVDCSKKEQQVAMLQSMRVTGDERLAAHARSWLNPFGWSSSHDVAYNNPNKFINYHLNSLRYCP